MHDIELVERHSRASLDSRDDQGSESRYPSVVPSLAPSRTPSKDGRLTDAAAQPGGTNELTYQDVDTQFITGIKLYLVVLAVTLAIPRITSQFHSLQDVGWYGSAYLITNSSCQLTTGKIYQYYKTKWVYMIFLGIFELGSLLCAVSQSSKMLCVSRAVAGLGASGLVNGSLTIIATSSPPDKRPGLTGIAMAISLLGIVCGPLLGGVITQHASWRWCFYINLPIGALSAIVCLLVRIPDASKKSNTKPTFREAFDRLDPIGFFLFAPFCVMLLLALQWGGDTYRWDSATIIGLFVGCGACLCVFILWEYHVGARAIMPLAMISKPVIFCSCIVAFCNFGGMNVMVYYLTQWFQAVKHDSPTMAGVYSLGTILPQILGTLSAGILISRIGYPMIIAMFGCACAAIGSGLLTLLVPSTGLGKFLGYQVIMGFGRGAVVQQPITSVQNAVPPEQLPVSTALVVFSQYFGGAIFVAVGQTAFINSLGVKLAQYAPGVPEQTILTIGATNLRNGVIAPDQLPGVLLAYNDALTIVFYVAVGAACAAFFASMGMVWRLVPQKKETPENDSAGI